MDEGKYQEVSSGLFWLIDGKRAFANTPQSK
jgi:hypothetical protein